MSGRFENKVSLVTGATSGIGMVTAQMLAAEGSKVMLAARRSDRGKALVEEIQTAGGEATFVQTDVAQRDSIVKMVQTTLETYGRLDCAFNNAGIAGSTFVAAADIEEEAWDQIMNVNVKGVWLCMKYQIPELLKSGGGAIVNNASIYGLRGSSVGAADYIATHGRERGRFRPEGLAQRSDGPSGGCQRDRYRRAVDAIRRSQLPNRPGDHARWRLDCEVGQPREDSTAIPATKSPIFPNCNVRLGSATR
jgi:NAD(P)-dependent dehydrogenase (short-subunit alcohol dehydrogenase family)